MLIREYNAPHAVLAWGFFMAIRIDLDELLLLGQLVRRIPPIGGARVNISTAWRWANKGVRGIMLETVQIGGRTCTTWQAYLDFAAAIASSRVDARPSTLVPSGRKQKHIKNARQVLVDAGINLPTSSTRRPKSIDNEA